MSLLTFQILEGMERGLVFGNLKPPITIGREEDNAIQLNDERVSRFHAKIQIDDDRIILTDLQSTNGTRVNGHAVQMHVLQIGDQLAIGRCLLVYGSQQQIEETIRSRQITVEPAGATISFESGEFDLVVNANKDPDEEVPRLFPAGFPELPGPLRPAQVAQLADVLAHIHDRIQSVASVGRTLGTDNQSVVQLDWIAWQRLLRLEMDVATYLKQLTEGDALED